MYIKPCPCCGRMPKITEGRVFKDGTRRRFIGCPNYCTVLWAQNFNNGFPKTSYCVFTGPGDSNTIYKIWNEKLI